MRRASAFLSSHRIPAMPRMHEPSVVERLELARSSLSIARFAAANGSNRRLAKREISRARTEIAAVSRQLTAARIRSILQKDGPSLEIGLLTELVTVLTDSLDSASRKLSSLKSLKN